MLGIRALVKAFPLLLSVTFFLSEGVGLIQCFWDSVTLAYLFYVTRSRY